MYRKTYNAANDTDFCVDSKNANDINFINLNNTRTKQGNSWSKWKQSDDKYCCGCRSGCGCCAYIDCYPYFYQKVRYNITTVTM